MFKKYLIGTLLIVGGCSGIPEVPDIPFMEPEEVKAEIETEIDPVAEFKSRGNGYLSFAYSSGHLDSIIVKLKNEQIVLSKGQTVVKKLPVGEYSFDVSGNQIDTESYSAKLNYNGHTHQAIFYIPSQYSKIGLRSISDYYLDHELGQLVVGSSLVAPLIEVTKLDRPPYVLEIMCYVDLDLEVGETFNGGKARGEIAKVTTTRVLTGFTDRGKEIYGIKSCGYSDKVTYTSPLRMTLPEGLYRMNASGKAKNLYVRGGTVNTVEITSNGFEWSTADLK